MNSYSNPTIFDKSEHSKIFTTKIFLTNGQLIAKRNKYSRNDDEIEALIGAKKLIEKCKPFIHIEAKKKVMVKQNISMNDIEDYFESINYKQVLSVKSELLYAPK